MLLVDANVLLYAVNSDSAEHAVARRWMEARLSGHEAVGFAWIVLLAFVRIGTRPGLLPSPMSLEEAFTYVEEWLRQPPARVVSPTARHAGVLRGMLEPTGTGGNLVSDAHLAALAAEHGATVCSFDHDFQRFPGCGGSIPVQERSEAGSDVGVLGLGVDAVEIPRVERALRRTPALAGRVWTDAEQRTCRGPSGAVRVSSLAARFAAKEAVAKALGTGVRGFAFRDVEILADDLGRPTVHLHAGASALADRLGVTHWHCSLSHTGGLALASVVAEGAP